MSTTESLKNPFYTLIPEILSQIFIECLPDESQYDGRNIKASLSSLNAFRCAPLHLTRVCSYWRDVALSTPLLWSRIVIIVGDNKPHPQDIAWRYAKMVKVFMERSIKAPVSIILVYQFFCNMDMGLAIKELVTQSDRWGSLRVESRAQDAQPFLNALSRGGVDKLAKLDISLRAPAPSFDLEFTHLQHISSVSLSGAVFSLKPPQSPLHNLRSLQIDNRHHKCHSWLPFTPNLEHLSIQCRQHHFRLAIHDDDTEELRHADAQYPLPHLKSLRLFGEHQSDVARVQRLLKNLTTPKLRILQVGMKAPDIAKFMEPHLQAAFAQQLFSFLNRSHNPALTELCIESPLIGAEDAFRILQDIPSLEGLTLCRGLTSRAVIESLVYHSEDPQIPLVCPELRRITIAVNAEELGRVFDEELLIALIISRCPPLTNPQADPPPAQLEIIQPVHASCQRLSEITIHGLKTPRRSKRIEEHPDIVRCRGEGLQLNLISRPVGQIFAF